MLTALLLRASPSFVLSPPGLHQSHFCSGNLTSFLTNQAQCHEAEWVLRLQLADPLSGLDCFPMPAQAAIENGKCRVTQGIIRKISD